MSTCRRYPAAQREVVDAQHPRGLTRPRPATSRKMRGFAAGLRKDWPAVTAGLTLPWSSGTVEGHVNRIKMIKRQMYGRARPDLLRKRVLLAD